MTATIECSWAEFKRMAREFHDEAPSLDAEGLDNAWKCLGLGYLGVNEPQWQHSAATLLRIESQVYAKREMELEMRPQPPKSKD